MKKKVLFFTISIIIFFFLLFGFIFCLIIGSWIVLNEEEEFLQSQSTEVYRYFEFNPHTNLPTTGFVSLPTSSFVGKNGLHYQHHNNNEGEESHVLISKFDDISREYKCSAVCVCEVEEENNFERRNSGVKVIKTGLTFLVAAVSSLIAYERAKDYFEKTCTSTVYLDDVNCNDIEEELLGCDEIEELIHEKKGHKAFYNPFKDNFEIREKVREGDEFPTFFCAGRCSTNKNVRVSKRMKELQESECGTREFKTFISASCEEYENDLFECEKEVIRKIFKTYYMDQWCENHSIGSVTWLGENYGVDDSKKRVNEQWDFLKKLCISDFEDDIHCRQQRYVRGIIPIADMKKEEQWEDS